MIFQLFVVFCIYIRANLPVNLPVWLDGVQDSRLLCRVFSENTSNTEISLDCNPLIEMEQKNTVASSTGNAEIDFCDDSKSEAEVNEYYNSKIIFSVPCLSNSNFPFRS